MLFKANCSPVQSDSGFRPLVDALGPGFVSGSPRCRCSWTGGLSWEDLTLRDLSLSFVFSCVPAARGLVNEVILNTVLHIVGAPPVCRSIQGYQKKAYYQLNGAW